MRLIAKMITTFVLEKSYYLTNSDLPIYSIDKTLMEK